MMQCHLPDDLAFNVRNFKTCFNDLTDTTFIIFMPYFPRSFRPFVNMERQRPKNKALCGK